MRQILATAFLAAGLLAAAAAMPTGALAAGDEPDGSPGTLALDGLDQLMRAFDRFIETFPRFEPPRMNEDGDIIIRRKPAPESAPPAAREDDGGIWT